MKKSEPTSFADIFKARATKPPVKAPAYPWQDLALRVIKELSIPNFKLFNPQLSYHLKLPFNRKRHAVMKRASLCRTQNRNELKRRENPRSENPGYANWSEAEIPEGNSIRPLKNKLFTDENRNEKTLVRSVKTEPKH